MSLSSALARIALTPASRNRLSVLIYHRVPAEPDELLPGESHAAEFERTMRWVKETFNVIPLRDGVAGIKSGKLPPRALSITFDDGYANNATVAAPILNRLGLHATFFIATGYLDGGRMFNDTVIEAVRACREPVLDLSHLGLGHHATSTAQDRRKAVDSILRAVKYKPDELRAETAESVAAVVGVRPARDLMMSSEQVASLARSGFELGGHTVNHPILAGLPYEVAFREIESGKKRIEEIANGRVTLFAYPNGKPAKDYDSAAANLVSDLGFEGAVSTSSGAAVVGSDPFQIPRFTPWSVTPQQFARQMLSNLRRVAPEYVNRNPA